MRRAVCLILACLMLTGCAVSEGRKDAPGWMAARGADFMDIFGVRIAVGAGLGLYVRATEYVQLGVIKKGASDADMPSPREAEARAFPFVVVGNVGRYGGVWSERSTEVMLPGWSNRDAVLTAESSPPIQRRVIAGYVSQHGEYDNWRGAFGLGAHLLLVGVEAEVRPFEVLDFLAGLAGYDPSGDDLPPDALYESSEPLGEDSATNN